MDYKLIRSKRKTLAIRVHSDASVEVRAPMELADEDVLRYVTQSSNWILKKQTQLQARQPQGPCSPVSQYRPGEFEEEIRELLKKWESRLGVHTAHVSVRRMSSRWGSCTSKTRRIRLNATLEYCPRTCLEYVVVHELAHIIENNHSKRYWALVASMLPDYKARQETLRQWQWVLRAL